MHSKLRVFVVFFVIVFFSVFLFGCKHETIKFYRESAASSLIDKFKTNDTATKKTKSGIIILKDESQNNTGIFLFISLYSHGFNLYQHFLI